MAGFSLGPRPCPRGGRQVPRPARSERPEDTEAALRLAGTLALLHCEHPRAEGRLREALALCRELGDRWRVASALENLAETAQASGLPERAARLFGAVEALRGRLRAPVPPAERVDRDDGIRAARADLGGERFEGALAAGCATRLEDAMALAMRGTPDKRKANCTRHGLSAREVEVLGLVAEGLTDQEVAGALYLSPRTVGQHLRNVYRKLGVSCRTATTREAIGRGLI